jgi:hypothetical protein
MTKKEIQKEIKETEEKLRNLKQQLAETENPTEWIQVPGTDYEVTKEVLHKGKSYDKLKAEFGEDYLNENLLTLKQIGEICEHPKLLKELKMDSSSTKDDFFFKQPFPQNLERGYVARFYADSDGAYLYCWASSDYSDSSLGVRFARKILKGNKTKKN